MRSPVFNASITNDLSEVSPYGTIEVTLGYDLKRPLSVLLFIGDSEQIEWEFSRELLLWGLDEDSGEGDVILWPSATDLDTLHILLRSPSGSALLGIDRAGAWDFLEETYALHNGLVKPSEVDAAISNLLGEASK